MTTWGKELYVTAKDWFDNPKSPFQSYNLPIPENLVINKSAFRSQCAKSEILTQNEQNPHNHHCMFFKQTLDL